jgi:two-component system, chemotaxis family, sensor kinase CheA
MANSLNKIRHDLNGLHPDDQQTLVQIGAALQQMVSELPGEAAITSELLMLCLSGLQAIYQQTYTDFAALKQAIEATTIAAEQCLGSPENPVCQIMAEQAREAMSQALRYEPAVAANASPAPAELLPLPEILSLDDAAAFFMQVQPDEARGLVHLRDALKSLATQDKLPAEVKKLVIKAGKTTEQLLRGKAADTTKAFANIGQLLSDAALANDFAQHDAATSSSTPVEPAPATPVSVETPIAPVSPSAPTASDDATFRLFPADADLALMGEFVAESSEYMEGAEAALLALESDPDDVEAVNTVFRAFHTIKGTAAFLGLEWLANLAHLAESLLSRVRDHEIRCTGGYADLALRSADTLKELIHSVQQVLQGNPPIKPAIYDELMLVLANPEAAGVTAEKAATTLAQDVLDETESVINEIESINDEPILSNAKAQTGGVVNNDPRLPARAAANTSESFVRVRTDRLDSLIDIVGELVIAQSMIAQDETVVSSGQQDLARKAAHASKIVRELQGLGMAMRMVPLKATFQKMTRLVRDVALKSGKLVEFETEGEDTEIDRNMVDIIGDPLIHMIRNAVDHGIELPHDRVANGKSEQGTVRLAAYHAGGYVVVELQDDGKGLDRDKIVRKAIEKGLIESDKGMSSGEIFSLIFAPGFSTADQVSDLSGRGVGMDVVKRNIESLRGRIHITSEAGKGSLFMMRLPLTLAITDGMLVRVGTERYIISTVNIYLSFRPTADSLSTIAGRGEMVMLRGELMPLFRLHQLFDVPDAITDPTQGLLVVVADGKRRCAVLVDELLGQQQVVAKSLGNGIGKIQGISGGAILGDGRVGLIIDVPELVALVRQTTNISDRKPVAMQAAV